MSARWEIRFTKRAKKDADRLTPKLKDKLRDILVEVLALNPYEGKKLLGDLSGSYSYRLTFKDRIVYSLDEKRRIIYIERARTHYGE
ncbi:MAG: type II toxin-antitoxin system RelE/ParE family toxin [Candidatus Rokubacteria bacterium]|nr:type II toxin-antitoxin system RelE/ParE family toxin [Candidatus Rokubacteria bacterium]